MGWFRKIFHVFLVVAVAALMSIPFKRVPPQQMTKSSGRGEWQLVKPRLQFKQLIKPVEPANNPADESVPANTPVASPSEPERQTPKSPGVPPIGRPIPVDDPPAIRDQEAYPTAPVSRLPRIETQPARQDRFHEEPSPPSLPSEFDPLDEMPKPRSTTADSAPHVDRSPDSPSEGSSEPRSESTATAAP